jgi:xylulokinase
VAALLGIDLGTTTLKAVAFDDRGTRLAAAAVEPPSREITIDGCAATVWPAEELWDRICELLRRVMASLSVPVAGLAIVELGLAGVPILRDGSAGYPAVAWMSPSDPLDGMTRDLDSEASFHSTGNRVNPIYPPSWISWLRRHDPDYPREFRAWLYTGDYIAYRLSGEIGVDFSMASQTTVLDQHTLSYRDDLLDAYGLTSEIFPSPRAAGTPLGAVTAAAATATGLAVGTPVIVGGADFVAGAYGAGFLDPGAAAIITGTWECTVMCSDKPETGAALGRTAAICDPHLAPHRWSVRVENLSGDVAEWYREQFYARPADATEPVPWATIIDDAASVDPGSGGVVFLPHVFGSFGPILDERARGAFVGLTNYTTRAHLTRAVFEGLSYQSRHALEVLAEAMSQPVDRVVMMGGGLKNPVWTQARADIIGRTVEVVDDPDVTPRGAAMTAGVGAGTFTDFHEAARSMAPSTSAVDPDPENVALYDAIFESVYLPLTEVLTPANHQLAAIGERHRSPA